MTPLVRAVLFFSHPTGELITMYTDHRTFLELSVTLQGLMDAYFAVSMTIVVGLLVCLPITIVGALS